MLQADRTAFPIMGFSCRINRKLSPKSFRTISHKRPFFSCFTQGILIKISITAENRKQHVQTASTASSPYELYKIPPSMGPSSDARELIILMMELAAIRFS